jgi:predicted Na+-dependent transporter
MNIIVYLLLICVGFSMVGAGTALLVETYPNASPIWAVPAAIFLFVPSIFFGAYLGLFWFKQ